MPTVSHVTTKILSRKPFLEEALSKGILNYAALAEELQPEIQEELGGKVHLPAIVMALRRVGDRLQERPSKGKKLLFKDANITVRSDLVEITILKSSTAFARIRTLYDLIDFSKGDFLTLSQGLYEITLITNRKYESRIRTELKGEKMEKVITQLASLTIHIPLEAVEEMGLFYMITKLFYWENINIIELVSTLTELTFILKEKDIPKAYEVTKAWTEQR